jgi:CubicO group peptidase (beta-lactamase class C family)
MPETKRIARVVTLVLLLAGVCHAQTPATRMDQIVQSFVSDKVFMGSVLVARGDEIVLSKGYGFANLAWDIPNTPSTKFRLASLTKQFTAASILLLETRGKLKVEDPVTKYIPDAPAAWDKITIFHLLTHTSGMTRSIGSTPVNNFVAVFRDKPLESQPGEKHSYSNAGYVLLGHLIEKLSGQTYEKFVQENIFTPLGMKDSGYESHSEQVIARRASGYEIGSSGLENDDVVGILPHAAGALYSTTEDLLRWNNGLFGGKLLPAASVEKMTTPFKSAYGFGVIIQTVSGKRVILHSGGLEGFDTHLAYYPQDKITVAVLANLKGTAPDQIAVLLGSVARGENVTLASERKEISLPLDVLRRYVGAYKGPGDAVPFLITLQNNQLSVRPANQNPIPLFPLSETRFFLKVMDAEVEFSGKDERGRATQTTMYRLGNSQTATRDIEASKKLEDVEAATAKRLERSEAAIRRIIEEWRSGQPNFDLMGANLAAIVRRGPPVQSIIKERGAIQAITFQDIGPAGADIFQVKFADGLAEFRVQVDADGKVELFGYRSRSE